MNYRRKMYKVAPSILDEFNKHFNQTLLPTQLKYGARLVGRWMTKENDGVIDIFAIWEYDSYEDYEIIENKVKSDEEHVKRVQKWFQKMGGREKLKEVFFSIEQDFIETTVPLDKTILSIK
ncbi:NIPSNAP family protein [Aquibacillus koreensis]|uniref:NIPSNAP family protein n=1 Tax=Aquibacillus koreensis TaxID=279446 RepID=A0A9X3WPW7_9BACI|nr:NIPSNAP family protein [Aquibacillus koreensis]MCT2536236.1 NIPSNAP family protein [Aquibacillus koreensis]MDC3421411.1 NIPSNAP family protein [Aquibacillus koreensis]